jgi:hypothetical protein
MYIRVSLYCCHLIILWLFRLGTSCTVFVLICTVVVLYCSLMCMCGFCNVCVYMGFVMCGCFGNMCTVLWVRFFLTWGFSYPAWNFFRAFSLSCKANARAKLAKTGHGPHFSALVVICVVRLLFLLFYVLFVCKYVLPPGDNPIAVNKYINMEKIGTNFILERSQ